jgi:hypothetical protein
MNSKNHSHATTRFGEAITGIFAAFCLISAIIAASAIDCTAIEDGAKVEIETGFYYTVQKGDTMWNLSERFSDTPLQWPELWKENRQIPNPHRIFPGERIRLFKKEWIEKIAEPESTKEDIQEEAVKKEPPHYYYSAIDGIDFIKKEAITPEGSIFKVEDDNFMVGQWDTVYIKQKGDKPLEPGKKYAIYRMSDLIFDKELKKDVGYQHHICGIVEITKNGPDLSLGKIIRSFDTIELDDLIMPYHRKSPKITLQKSPEGIEAKIIRSQDDQWLIGDGTVAFMDSGRKDGIAAGQQYYVYDPETVEIDPESKEAATIPRTKFATILVIYTEATTATVLVTHSQRSLYPGVRVATPW